MKKQSTTALCKLFIKIPKIICYTHIAGAKSFMFFPPGMFLIPSTEICTGFFFHLPCLPFVRKMSEWAHRAGVASGLDSVCSSFLLVFLGILYNRIMFTDIIKLTIPVIVNTANSMYVEHNFTVNINTYHLFFRVA